MEKVFVKNVEKLDYSVVEDLIRQTVGDRKYGKVIIKPNLCFHQRIPGATTSPDLVRFVTRYFLKRSDEVIVFESDALLNTADEAFDNLGIRKAVDEEGGKILNLTGYFKETKYKYLEEPFTKHDLFVNLPVLKTHEFALVTGAVKNMFGTVPEMKRIKYHPIIAKVLAKLCKIYSNQLVIMDGIDAMEGHGPTRGRSIRMNVLISGTNPAAIDTIASQIMGIPLSDVPHIQYARQQLGVDGVDAEFEGTSIRELAREFKRPQLDPITATKMWVWKHKIPNSILFASPLYPMTRFFGLKIRKATRKILGMEKIDE
ncbi:MAG: DUF362 domain-containing protein [Candidatus Aenigmatarchaeota archaeon]